MERTYIDIQKKFYNLETYKWSTKNVSRYIDNNNLPRNFNYSLSLIEVLNRFFNLFFESFPKKQGKKGAIKFIETLKKSKRANSDIYNYDGLRLKDDTSIIEFLTDMRKLKRHFYISHNEMVSYIHKNYQTNLSFSTLRRYYFDLTV